MILMDDIVREGHPALRKKAEEVQLPLTEEDKKLATEMLEYLINSQDPELSEKYGLRPGIGLAANQVNSLKRMFALHVEDENGELYSFVAINPKIVSHSVEKTYLPTGEGCLSVDRQVPGYVPRYARITAKFFTVDGEQKKLRLKGLPAVAFQHELDHLNGIMFYDHINQDDPFAPVPDSFPVE
ncbi:peptide deformylase [Ureibacillus massiliensis 4400831 = CIP 108448 = CCUG 49529]|uniref:Peptide deformylase n=1 Tax=Ureibacillus massiliensis 4400831 = CIP 108448 = CCUG 49529 TaxID=1211035 RepID=A0A0A3J5A5_9BACL|nr:peptide deformylase [Ureibacillus massiliensis]KGR92219.1 peptide deformylase [Ureibacillus massiliensis 4400831 = CIP 108448 = CCUG 49529]